MCLLWDIMRMLLYLTLHRSLQVYRSPLWSLTLTSFFVLHIMVEPASSMTSIEIIRENNIRDTTSEMFESDKNSTISSLPLDISSSSSVLQTPVADIISTQTSNSKTTAASELNLSTYTNQLVAKTYAPTSLETSFSSNKATQVSILPSFILSPTYLITTNLPVEILMSASDEWNSNTVQPLPSPFSSMISESYLKLSLKNSITVTSRMEHVSMASPFYDTVSLDLLNNNQNAAVSFPYTHYENLISEGADHSADSREDTSYFPYRTDGIDVFRTARFAENTLVSTTGEPSSRIEPSSVIAPEMTGEFSGVLALSDGGSWSLAGLVSALASQEPVTLANSPNDQQTEAALPQVNNTNNVIIHVEQKEWAVPVVASLSSVTFLAVVILLVVCGRHYIKKTRERRINMSQDGESLPTAYQQRRHHQNQDHPTDAYHVPGGWNSGHVSPKYDHSPVSLGRPATRHGRQPWSGLPRNESREYFEMFDLEKSRQDKMADNVDSGGEEWTTKFVQDKRLYDYGLGNHRLQNGRSVHQGEDADGIFGISPISTPGTPRRGDPPPPVFGGAAPRFAKQSATLSFEETRWSDAQRQMSKVNTIPPVKPKRVYAYDKLHAPESSHRQRLLGYDNRGFSSSEVKSSEPEKGQFMNDVGFTMNSDRYVHNQSKNYIHANMHLTQDVQRRNLPTVAERPQRILKCASYDESKLSAEASLNEVKVRPSRKVSTVSEPPREYLTVPESSILKSRWMYPSVDNLDQIDGFRTGSLASWRGAYDRSGTLHDHETERNAQPATSGEILAKNSHIARSSSDFVFPDISKASKKILEIRNSRKLGDVSRLESSELQGEKSARRDSSLDSDRSPPLHDDTSLFSVGTAKFSPNVPKIILTNESEEEGDNVPNQDQTSQQAATSVLRGVRKIARANNPFLIEGEKTVAKKSEKHRRASAPSMPYDLDPKTHLVTSHVMTRSSSSELLRVPKLNSSKGNVQTSSAWSREFYNLLNRTPEYDPEQRLMVKKMIDERYEALFGKKYTGIVATDQLDCLSPRLGKSRQAVKSKASSLERDGPLSHYERYPQDRKSETGSSHLGFRSDFRPRSDELWRTRNGSPSPAPRESSELEVRKSLTHGTDGCDNLSIESSYMAASYGEEERCLKIDEHLPENESTGIKDSRQLGPSHDEFEPAVRLGEIDKRKSTLKESSQDGGQGDTENPKGRLIAEQFDTRETRTLTQSRLTSDSDNADAAPADEDIVDVTSARSSVNVSLERNGQAGRVGRDGHGALHSFDGSGENVARNTDNKTSVPSKASILPTISLNEITCSLSQDKNYQIVSNEAEVNKQEHNKTVSRKDEDLNSEHIYSGTVEWTPANKNNKHDATTHAKLNENVEIRLELFPLGSQKDSPGSDANISHALLLVSPPNPGKTLTADDNNFHQPLNMEEGADFSDGLHDSIPSSRDISFIDTSEEDNRDASFDMDYFDSLLTSSV